MRLLGKVFFEGHIEVLTGLSIGGSKTDVTIGGIDNNVIKNAEGVPFLPGSSIKGKMRSLLEIKEGKAGVCNCGKCSVCAIFGTGAGNQEPEVGPTRLYVRDAMMDEVIKVKMSSKEEEFSQLELEYTESKWENVIDRKTSKAKHPRQQERVPAGAKFTFYFTYNLLEDNDLTRINEVFQGMKLLEDDYLGGNGSRGYGRIKFSNLTVRLKTINDYEGANEGTVIAEGDLNDLSYDKIGETLIESLKE